MEVRLEMNDEVKDEKTISVSEKDVIRSLAGLGALILALVAFVAIDDIIFRPITAESALYASIAFVILVLYGIFYSDTVKKILENNNTDKDHVFLRMIIIGMSTIYISRIIFLILEAWGEFSHGFNRGIELTVVFIGLYVAFERPREAGQEMGLREKIMKKIRPYSFPFSGTLSMALGLMALKQAHVGSALIYLAISMFVWMHYSEKLELAAKKTNRYVGIVPKILSVAIVVSFIYLLYYAFTYTIYDISSGMGSSTMVLLSFNYMAAQVLAIMAATYALKVPFYWYEVKNTFE